MASRVWMQQPSTSIVLCSASKVSNAAPARPNLGVAARAAGGVAAAPRQRYSASQIWKQRSEEKGYWQISTSRPTLLLKVKSMATPIRGGDSGVVDETVELTLDSIRESLIRQEDSIIYNLLERAQYKINPPTYDVNRFSIPGFEGSLVEYLLQETERLHAKVRRYSSPDEHPFFPDGLPESLLPKIQYPKVLHKAADNININPRIWKMYFDGLLPQLAAAGDDGNYGSTATSDVLCLQCLSKRVHYGKFVAESKYRESPDDYNPHIRAKNIGALYKLITFESVEEKVLNRVENKAATYGQVVTSVTKPGTQTDSKLVLTSETERPKPDSEPVAPDETTTPTLKLDPKLVRKLYLDWVMPLTKAVQIEYLVHRLDS